MGKIMTMANKAAFRIRKNKVSFVIINPFYVMCNRARNKYRSIAYILSIPWDKYI